MRVLFPKARRKVAGKREMVTFVSIQGELGDSSDSFYLALPLSSGELAIKMLGMENRE